MNPILYHLWGPFAIHSYGLFIAIGLIIFVILVMKDQRFTALHLEDDFYAIVIAGICAAIIGGRMLYVISEHEHMHSPLDLLAFWQGGLSILGGVIGTIVGLSLFLWYKNIPILPFFDLIAIYAPLLQAVARIGCFYAGCCFGLHCSFLWAIMYTDSNCYAPLYTPIHPTQLYSALLLMIIFICLFIYSRRPHNSISGMYFFIYITCISAERFFIDFWRADRCMINNIFSYNQIVALFLITMTLAVYTFLNSNTKKKNH